jgi:tetratricopeptide (TPR) repeat protein
VAQNDNEQDVGNPSDFSEETNPNIEMENLLGNKEAKTDSPSLEALTKAGSGAKSSTAFKPFGKPTFGVPPTKSPSTSTAKPAAAVAPAKTAPVKPAAAAPAKTPIPSTSKPIGAPAKALFKPIGTGIGPRPTPTVKEQPAEVDAEAQRQEAERAEEARLAQERADQEEREAEARAAQERADQEAREAAEAAARAAQERAAAEARLDEESAEEEAERAAEREAQKAEDARLAKEAEERDAAEREAHARLMEERRAKDIAEAEAALLAELEAKRAEDARLAQERAEQESAEAAKVAERAADEARLNKEREEAARLEAERVAAEEARLAEVRAAEAARLAREKAEAEERAAKKAQEERERLDTSWQDDLDRFRTEQQKLARARDWPAMASLTTNALQNAPWTKRAEARSHLLLDLARLQRDRLQDQKSAEEAFRQLVQVDPANWEALDYLENLFRAKGDWKSLHDMLANSVEPDWDPNSRLERTRAAAKIAREKLEDQELATTDWERLWRLGDATEEALLELNHAYRLSGNWARLASFLQERVAKISGMARLLVLRELGEVCLTALRDHEKAAAIFTEILAANQQDPIARLAWARILVRRKDFAALEAFAEGPKDASDIAALDLSRLAADALWQADEKVRSVMVYDRILSVLPADEEALRAKEEFLAQNDQYELLCTFLVDRAEVEEGIPEKVSALERAATVAEKELSDLPRAAQLLEQAAKLDPSREKTFNSLIEIYDQLGDMEGVARALEGLLLITRAPQSRVVLLRKLGDHYSQRLGNDDKAEQYWREILSIISQDDQVEDELLALHRRRGQFEALDAALQRQIWRTEDSGRAVAKAREAARNCETAIDDPVRAREAWLRLLDIAPDDPEALTALSKHYAQYGAARDAISATESQLRGATDIEQRRNAALQVAKRWESVSARLLSLSSYEQALSLDPTCEEALLAIQRLRANTEVGVALSSLERASAANQTPEQKIQTLGKYKELLPEDAPIRHFELLRRTLWISQADPKDELLTQLSTLSEKASIPVELSDIFARLRWRTTSSDAALSYSQQISAIAKDKLENPTRAFLELFSVGFEPNSVERVLEQVVALAEKTERYEDLLSIWETRTRAALPVEERRRAISARAKICEEKLKDSARSFWEWRRLLDIDPLDKEAHTELERLASEKGFWRQLDAIYAELWDRTSNDDARVSLARQRQKLQQTHLNDAIGALDTLSTAYRIAPEALGLRAELLTATEEAKAWSRILPLLEGAERAKINPSPAELSFLASLYEKNCQANEQAFALYREAFAWEHESVELEGHLERLAEVNNDFERLAESLRRAASLTIARPRALSLYHKVAGLYEKQLASPARALEIHRRILRLDDTAINSLEVVIQAVRKQGDWTELRELLQQWLKIAPADAPRVDKWIEIATIAREKLNDEEGALFALSRVLEIEPQHPSAEAQLKELSQRPTDPSLELKRLKLELTRAQPPRRQEIFMRMSELQEQLGDIDGAIVTLRTLITETSVTSPGSIALEKIYRKYKRNAELFLLLESRADAITEPSERLELLSQSIAVCEECNASNDLERLYRKLLTERPGDEESLFKLAAILRSSGRFEDLSALLRANLNSLDANAKHELERELGRILRGLGKQEEAKIIFQKLLQELPSDAASLVALSMMTPAQDIELYSEYRRKQAKSLPAQAAAFVFCYLAEVADETNANPLKVSAFYREARQIDPDNESAAEALKSLGRRAKGWRQTAALLPDADEATLKPNERAQRLAARAAKESTPKGAANWYWRAVAVDPTLVQAWDQLAQIYAKQNDAAMVYCTRQFGLAAYEYTSSLDTANLQEHATRIFDVSLAARAANNENAAKRYASLSYHTDPSFMAPIVTIADEAYDQGELAEAYRLYDRALSKGKSLNDRSRLHAIYRRGILARRSGKRDRAVQDLRETLRVNPLHGDSLAALAEILSEENRAPAAVQHHIQALIVENDPKARGARYLSIGKLLEDKLGFLDEAGFCYQEAQSAGIQERDLTKRALRYYRRIDEKTKALSAIDELLQGTQEVRELADLWTTRGLLETNSDRAMEAFDMALSYVPGHREALSGLAKLLEEKGEWAQLLDIYEARLEGGKPSERADTLRQMARISEKSLGDNKRAEGYLQQSCELDPKREDVEHLLELIGDAPERHIEKRNLTGRLVEFGPNWYSLAIDFAKILLRDDERRWAWYLLSPMTQMAFPEASLKTTLQDLRKEFEKRDNLAAFTPNLRDTVKDPNESKALNEILEELDNRLTGFGWQTPEDAGATGASRLDERTAPGKLFRQLASSAGMEDAVAWRVQDMPEPIAVLNASPAQVLIRADLVQSLSSSDLAFVMAMGLDMAMPGRRLLLGCSAEDRAKLVPALCTAVGISSVVTPLSEKIAALIDDATRLSWVVSLGGTLMYEQTSLTQRHHEALLSTARRLGSVVAGDLRLASRAVSRLYENEAVKTQGLTKASELDEHLAEAPILRTVLAFACSANFGKLLEK